MLCVFDGNSIRQDGGILKDMVAGEGKRALMDVGDEDISFFRGNLIELPMVI
jgi:hypothetical protein